MSLETDFFFSQVPYFDQILDGQGPRSLNYENRHQSMQTIHLTDRTDKKSNTGSKNDDEKSDQKNMLDLSNIFSDCNKNQSQSRLISVRPKQSKSLLPEILNKKIKSSKTEITVFFFDTNKKIIFTRNQLNKLFTNNPLLDWKNENNRQNPTLKQLIPYMVKSYCKLFLNFQPIQVDHETFQLKLANSKNKEDPILDPIDHDQQIMWLYEGNSYVLVRKKRNKQKIIEWQNSLDKIGCHDMQALQIITPMKKRQIVEQFEKNKNVSALKDKILSYNQLGKIVIMTYSSFKVCEPKKKISDIVHMDRVFEVYREKVGNFIDIEMYKKTKQSALQEMKPQKQEVKDQNTNNQIEYEVSNSPIFGNLYLKIQDTTMIQVYEGGLLNLVTHKSINKIQRSLYALTGISVRKKTIKLKFMDKNGTQTYTYNFREQNSSLAFIKSILRVGRSLKQNLEKII